MKARAGRAHESGLARQAWELGWTMIARPDRAAERLKTDPDVLSPSLALFLVHMAVGVAFYSWKPASFAAGEDPLGLGAAPLPQSPVFWARVRAWDPVLTGILLYFLAWLAGRLKGGRLPLCILAGALVWVVPLLALVLWSGGQLPKWGLLATWLLALAFTIPAIRSRPPESWRPLAAFCLAVTALNLALCPLFIGAVALGQEGLYKGLELALLGWTLALGSYLVSRLEELPTARAFAALLFALIAQMIAVFSLRVGGLVSKDILKALMSV